VSENVLGREHQACARQALIARLERLLADVPGRTAPLVAASRDPARIHALLASELETALLLAACMGAGADRRNPPPTGAAGRAGERDRSR